MSLAWVVVFLAVFLIGLTKSGFGSGVGLMIVPMTVMGLSHTRFGGGAALGLMLPLLIAGDLLAIWQYRRLFSLQIVRKLLPGTFVGVVLGAALLWWFHHQPLARLTALIRLEVGLEAVILVSLHWYRVWRGNLLHGEPTPTAAPSPAFSPAPAAPWPMRPGRSSRSTCSRCASTGASSSARRRFTLPS